MTRGAVLRLAVLFVALFIAGAAGWSCMMRMPGKSFAGPLPALSAGELAIRDELRRDVQVLAGEIGERNIARPTNLARAADHIAAAFAAGGREVRREGFLVGSTTCENLYVDVPGRKAEAGVVVIGAHYDSALGCPGANDNATGVAAVLALARRLAGSAPRRTLRLVAFVNEEPPFFRTPRMGSAFHARGMKERGERAAAMLSLETIGCYRDEEGSQQYPAPLSAFYPSRGDFIAFVSDVGSRDLVYRAIATFRRHATIPSEGGALPAFLPGVSWSDQWAFWQEGFPAAMVTDTAPFRYPEYHTDADTPEKIDYDRAARVVAGILEVAKELIGVTP